MGGDSITRRDHGQTLTRVTTVGHVLHLTPFQGFVLEVEDEHFHLDSAVLLPNYTASDEIDKDQGPSLDLAVLAECVRHAAANPKQSVLIAGHADTSGPDAYNLTLSKKRANAVYHAIMGNRSEWVAISQAQHKPEDYQLIFKWAADVYEWDCDPGPVDNNPGPQTEKATKNFQAIYNTEFAGSIAVDGIVGPETWGAIFDVYMDMVEQILDTDDDGMAKLRATLHFLGPKVVGCGENFPIEEPRKTNYRSRVNRRVEILFFDPGQEPRLDCHPGGETCNALVCEVYNPKMYKFTHIPVNPPVLAQYHLHVDADRDGKADDDRTHLDKWEWGKGKKGAILLCNSDDDGGRHKTDHTDDVINAGNDKDECAPLVIRKKGGGHASAGWVAFLEVSADDAKRIRIFESRSTGAKEVLGPTTGASFQLPDLNFDEKEFGVEATRYASQSFSGELAISFKIKRGSVQRELEKAVFRVAPWIMPNHLDAGEKVFVVDCPVDFPSGPLDNSTFRSSLSTFLTGAGCTLTTHASDDRWMQDCMEFGYASLPGQGFRSVVRAQRPRELKTFPKTLLAADLGFHVHGDPASMIPGADPGSKESTFNSTGNLECTPPAKSKAGKNYPFGRIYHGTGRPGEEMDAVQQAFLDAQIVQEPIKLNTNWLAVGHVDEFISFVAAPGDKGFKMLLASPRRAYEILKANQAAHGPDKLLTGRQFPEFDLANNFVGWSDAEVSIQDYLTKGILTLAFGADELKDFNDKIQSHINAERKKMENAIGLEAGDIIEVPILYSPNQESPDFADALTGGMVNMLVVNKNCLVPQPFGPVVGGKDLFQEDLNNHLTPLGLTVTFIDDWFEYHVALGEVHCGTNTLRKPTAANWWEFTP